MPDEIDLEVARLEGELRRRDETKREAARRRDAVLAQLREDIFAAAAKVSALEASVAQREAELLQARRAREGDTDDR